MPVLQLLDRKCNSFRGRLKQQDKFKCFAFTSQKRDTTEKCPDIELDDLSIEFVERFFYLGEMAGVRGYSILAN